MRSGTPRERLAALRSAGLNSRWAGYEMEAPQDLVHQPGAPEATVCDLCDGRTAIQLGGANDRSLPEHGTPGRCAGHRRSGARMKRHESCATVSSLPAPAPPSCPDRNTNLLNGSALEPRPDGGGAAGAISLPLTSRVSIADVDANSSPPLRVPGSPDFLRSDENAARVVAGVRERERVLLPAVFALPDAVAGTPQRRTRTGRDAVFRHGAAGIERKQARKRKDRRARLTVPRCDYRSPHASDGSCVGL